MQVFTQSLSVSNQFVEHWTRVLEKAPRHAFVLQKESDVLKALEMELRTIGGKTTVTDVQSDLKDEIMVYSTQSVGTRGIGDVGGCSCLYLENTAVRPVHVPAGPGVSSLRIPSRSSVV